MPKALVPGRVIQHFKKASLENPKTTRSYAVTLENGTSDSSMTSGAKEAEGLFGGDPSADPSGIIGGAVAVEISA